MLISINAPYIWVTKGVIAMGMLEHASDTGRVSNGSQSAAASRASLLPMVLFLAYLWVLWQASIFYQAPPSPLEAGYPSGHSGFAPAFLLYLFVGLIVAIVYDTQMSRLAVGRYFIDRISGRHVYHVFPAPVGIAIWQVGLAGMVGALVIPAISIGLFSAVLGTGNGPSVKSTIVTLFGFAFAVLISLGLYKLGSKLLSGWTKRHRVESRFEIDAQGLRMAGHALPSGAAHRVILRNPVFDTEQECNQAMLVVGTGLTDQAVAAGESIKRTLNEMGRARKRQVGRISYHLDVEAGGRAYTLAGGLDEVTANGLMNDVARDLFDWKPDPG